MKACSRNRKPIAWLALSALDARAASALREHLARCDGCRRYWEEMSTLAERMASARPASSVEASEGFLRRVGQRLASAEAGSTLDDPWLLRWLRDWRVALPAAALPILLLLGAITLRHPWAHSVAGPSPVQDLSPTLVNYQMVASRSLDELDALLTKQASKGLPPAPVYTASALAFANGTP